MKVTLGLLMLSIGLIAAFLVHANCTGVVIPYQDPTPEQAAYERFHLQISKPLFFGAVISFAVCLVSAVVEAALWLIRKHRAT